MDKQSSAVSARTVHTYGLWLTLLAGCSAMGCTSFASMQDLHYSWTNKHRASSAWASNTTSAQRRELGGDYAKGFKQGFYDAATGRGCKTPAVPPPCYWSTKYQCCEGQECIQNWFCGYQCGVTAADGKGFPKFHDVPVGPCAPTINRSGCQGCYSPDYCECGACGSGQCSSGQCSDGVHPDLPDNGQIHQDPAIYHEGSISPAAADNSIGNSIGVPPQPDFHSGSDGVGEGYVTQTNFQTSYEELFAPKASAQ